MATTTEEQIFNIRIVLTDVNVHNPSPAELGYALNEALKTMPDEPMDYVFDSAYQEPGAEDREYELTLRTPFAAEPTGPAILGRAYITLAS